MANGTEAPVTGEAIMRHFRRANYTHLTGEPREKALEVAERLKNASWNRGRPGKHDDKEWKDLLGDAEAGASEVEALENEHDDAYEKSLELHAAQVAAEAEARAKGERPPVEFPVHPEPQPAP